MIVSAGRETVLKSALAEVSMCDGVDCAVDTCTPVIVASVIRKAHVLSPVYATCVSVSIVNDKSITGFSLSVGVPGMMPCAN